jgi:type III secretion system FlhB-like substrate exporter
LRYQQDEDEAPVLVAKGEGELARAIVHAARAYGIPVVQDVPVARALSELSEGDAIPSSLYEAIAVILRDVLDQADSDDDRPGG